MSDTVYNPIPELSEANAGHILESMYVAGNLLVSELAPLGGRMMLETEEAFRENRDSHSKMLDYEKRRFEEVVKSNSKYLNRVSNFTGHYVRKAEIVNKAMEFYQKVEAIFNGRMEELA